MQNELPVREIVLYKHGVGFFVRQGRVTADHIRLNFRKDEINDVLKSLAVLDRAGGQVLGLHYQTPKDKDDRLASSSIRLSDAGALRDLLRDLRGRRVKIVFETSLGTPDIVIGRVMGIDEPQFDDEKAVVLVRTESGEVRAFELRAFRSLSLEDSLSSEDLSYFLQSSMSEDDRRTVHVRLSSGEHDLFVSYVAPSPTWRVTYRIVAQSDQTGGAGKALLQGWGLFDNRLEEDLENVKVTLVAGQPISFVYDLYASKIPQRPLVNDESRITPGPVHIDGMMAAFKKQDTDPDLEYDEEAMLDMDELEQRLQFSDRDMTLYLIEPEPENMAQSNPAQAEGKDTGEFFQYEVTTPVSVKRGESALVPIISKEVSYSRELLYNGEKLADHPVISLRIMNDTGLTLERGPITVVEDNTYKGEAIVPFTRPDHPVYLPYAVELGVRVTEREERGSARHGLSIERQFIMFSDYETVIHTYEIENNLESAVTLTIEVSMRKNWELYETRDPDSQSAREMRWIVEVPARAATHFTFKQRRLFGSRQSLRSLKYVELDRFLRNQWLDQATYDRLSEMIAQQAIIENARKRKAELEYERSALHQTQEQIRANMQALQTTGPEAEFRSRLLGELEESQNRLKAIDRTITDLDAEIDTAEANVQTIIADLKNENA